MSGPEFVVAIVAITCATGLLKKWMDQRHNNSIDDQKVEELQEAFAEHRQAMKKRIENLETGIAEDEGTKANFSQIEAPSSSDNSLTNDLNKKEQASS